MLPGEAVHGARKSAAKAEFDVDAALAWQRVQRRKVRSNAVLKRDFGRVPEDLPAAQASRTYSREREEWKDNTLVKSSFSATINGGSLMVQHYIEETGQADHLRLVSISENIYAYRPHKDKRDLGLERQEDRRQNV
jgi:hypothetical protein